eukprot:2858248-Alexandrium_andersonii.AAC.1
MWGLPFGAGHAVPNFYRVAEWLCRAARRFLMLLMDHFFDDYFYCEWRLSAASALWSFRRFCQILGFAFDPKKEAPPASLLEALGVVFDSRALRASGTLQVRPKAKR